MKRLSYLIALCGLASVVVTATTAETDVPGPGLPKPKFHDVTWEWQLHAQHQQRRESLAGLTETLGAGACVLDFDGDGWMDLLLVGGSGQRREFGAAAWWQSAQGHRLFRNDSGRGFIDVTPDSGLAASWGMGCATADWDSDGDEDLLITGFNSTQLYRNEGAGRFSLATASAIEPDGWATSASVADYDGDGRLDIYITCFIDYQRGQRTFEAGSGFATALAASFKPALYKAQANRLYRNLGGLKFVELAEKAGVANSEGRSLQGLWTDLNADKAPDLVLTNARGSPPMVYLNNQHGSFNPANNFLRFSIGDGLHGAAAVTGGLVSSLSIIATTAAGTSLSLGAKSGFTPPDAWDAGLAGDLDTAFSGWGVSTGDFDNNGILDIVTANGLTTPDPDAPLLPLGQGNMIYQGLAAGGYRAQRLDLARDSSRAVVTLDANNDGALDLLVTNNNAAPQLLLGSPRIDKHWLGLAFEDSSGNPLTHGVGVTLRGADQVFSRQLSDRQGFLASSEPRIHLGLGSLAVVAQLEVYWPDGSRSQYSRLPVNNWLTLRQGQQTPDLSATRPTAKAVHPHNARHWYDTFSNLYVQLLVWAGPAPAHRNFLLDVSRHSPTALAAAIEALPDTPLAAWLFLLARGIDSNDEDIQLSALDRLQQWELESSVRHLLPLLSADSPGIQCRAARVFEAFFREEEAVIHHKYLAVPLLVQMLQNEVPAVQICAMQALAEAERFRGLNPLLGLAASNNPELALQAIRTLGRIRQREAIPGLEALARKLAPDPALVGEINWALAQLGSDAVAGSAPSAGMGPLPASRHASGSELSALQLAKLAELRQYYNASSASAERALLAQLDALDDLELWRAFLGSITSTARGKRLLIKNLHHSNVAVATMVIAHGDALPGDARYQTSLWRLLTSPGYPRLARFALAARLGEMDAGRVLALLPAMEKQL